MCQSLEALNLTLASFFLHWILQLNFIVDLHCVLPLITVVEDETYLSVSAGSDDLTYLVVVQRI